jgi:hypothetical protein
MPVSVPPVWELVVTVLATYAITGLVDHDRPLRSVWQLARAELQAAGRSRTSRSVRFSASRVRVRGGRATGASQG